MSFFIEPEKATCVPDGLIFFAVLPINGHGSYLEPFFGYNLERHPSQSYLLMDMAPTLKNTI